MLQFVLFVLGSIIFALGIFLLGISNFSLGILLTVLLGGVLLLWAIFYRQIKMIVPKWIKIIFWVVLCFEIALVSFITLYGNYDNADFTEDAVVVLGAGVHGDIVTMPLKHRLDAAIAYHEKNPDAYIVVSGGQGRQETVTEAYAMEKYLLKKGVDPNVIIKEEKATSTAENMRFSKEILDQIFQNEYQVVVITNNFHIYRAVSIAKKEGFFYVRHMHGNMEWYEILPNYLRESLAVLKLWMLD